MSLSGIAGCLDDDDGEPAPTPTPTPRQTPGEDTPTPDETPPDEETPTPETDPADTYVDEIDDQVRLVYGEPATLSTGVEVAVLGVEIEESAGEEIPEDRDAFAWIHLESENTSDESQDLPTEFDFEIIFGDQQVGRTFRSAAYRETERERYEGGNVQGGVHREGYLLFEVDDGYNQSSIDVLWHRPISDIDVRWSDEW